MKTTTRRAVTKMMTLTLLLGACSQDAGDNNDGDGKQDSAEDLVDPFTTAVLGGGCSVVNEITGKTITTEGSDGACPADVSGILDVVKDNAGPTFAVSEQGDQPGPRVGYRFVVPQRTSANNKPQDLFLSVLSRTDTGVSQGFLEVMAFSQTKQAYNFYALEGGEWHFKGDGSMVTAGEEPAFECANCHRTGGLVMKELQDSWANWHSTWFDMPKPETSDATLNGLFSRIQRADFLEPIVIAGIQQHQKARVDRVLQDGGLKSLLREVLCDVEPNFIAAHQKSANRFGEVESGSSIFFPASILVTQLFQAPPTGSSIQKGYGNVLGMQLASLRQPRLDGPAYDAAVNQASTRIGGAPGDAMFPLLFPERSFADNMVAENLIAAGLLDKDILADLLMTDFTVPVFSETRCALAETAPDSGTSAEEIRTAWITNLEGSDLAGAAELKNRLADQGDFEQHQAAVDAFLAACRTRNTNNTSAYAADIVKLASQRRKEFTQQFESLIESPFLIPTDTLTGTAPGTSRLDATTCQLELQ